MSEEEVSELRKLDHWDEKLKQYFLLLFCGALKLKWAITRDLKALDTEFTNYRFATRIRWSFFPVIIATLPAPKTAGKGKSGHVRCLCLGFLIL